MTFLDVISSLLSYPSFLVFIYLANSGSKLKLYALNSLVIILSVLLTLSFKTSTFTFRCLLNVLIFEFTVEMYGSRLVRFSIRWYYVALVKINIFWNSSLKNISTTVVPFMVYLWYYDTIFRCEASVRKLNMKWYIWMKFLDFLVWCQINSRSWALIYYTVSLLY